MRVVRHAAVAAIVLGLAGCSSPPQPEYRSLTPNVFAMIIPDGVDPATLREDSRQRCGSLGFCQVHGWRDPSKAALGFPMTDAEAGSRVFTYVVNRSTGFEQALWNCGAYPSTPKESCLA